MSTPTWGLDPKAETITVYYEGEDTIYQGCPLCYNYDTTDNWMGVSSVDFTTTASTVTESGTTAEGSQNEGKFIRVELPSSTNFQWLAGYLVGHSNGFTGPGAVDVFVPNGAIIPVRAYADCSNGTTLLGLSDGNSYLGASTGDDDPIACAIAMEDVDRSGVAGVCLAKVFPTGQTVIGTSFFFLPSQVRNGRTYGCHIDGAYFFGGAAGAQEYLFTVTGDKSTAATGDCYGGLVYIKGENEATNAATYIFRSLNVATDNSGTLDRIENFLGAKNETAGTATNVIGATLLCENYGTTATGFLAAGDFIIRDEVGDTTDRCGIRIRNDDRSSAAAVPAVIKVEAHASSNSFTNLIACDAAGDIGLTASDGGVSTHKIPILIGATTRYLMVSDG